MLLYYIFSFNFFLKDYSDLLYCIRDFSLLLVH